MTDRELDRLLSDHVDAAAQANRLGWGDVLKRRQRRRAQRTTLGAGAAVVVVYAVGLAVGTGPAGDDGSDVTASRVTDTTATDTASASPGTGIDQALPPVPRVEPGEQPPEPLVLTGEEWTPVDVTSTCWQHDDSGFCADGFATPPYVTATSGDEATFAFPLQGWSFTASAQPLASPNGDLDPCTRFFDATVTASGSVFRTSVKGPAGRYLVHLFDQGPQGSVNSSFAWTTTTTRPSPPAVGYLALLADLDGALSSYGVEVSVRGLDRGYPDATATATVTAVDGSSETYGPYRQRDRNSCDDGSVFISSPHDEPWPTPVLGPGPYTYRVRLVLGGQTHVGTAVWPRDERANEAPNTDLVFDPPLPNYSQD